MSQFTAGCVVEYTGIMIHGLHGKTGKVKSVDARGWVDVEIEGQSYNCAQANLKLISNPNARQEALQACFDLLTGFMTDECPDDCAWEDFDPDVDGLRTQIQELM